MRIIMKKNYYNPLVEVMAVNAVSNLCAVSQNAQLDFGGAATGAGGNEISPDQGL